LGFGALALGILLISLMFLFQNAFKDEVRAGKTPAGPVAASSPQVAGLFTSGEKPQGVPSGRGSAEELKQNGAPPAAQTIQVSTTGAQANNPMPEEMLLRLHGSNTIGAKLAPALVSAYLKIKLNATGITSTPGAKEDEQILRATINGRRVAVEIQAHGSTTAFQDLAAGTCDIGDASRKIKDKEVAQLSFLGDMTSISNEHVIGLDGIAILVNKSNALTQISTKDLQAIFSGRITDWQGITGQQGAIAVYARDNNSGTFDTFKSLILGDAIPLLAGAERYESNSDLSDDVSRDPAGVGFTGLPYVREAKALAVSEEGAKAIYPNFFTVATEDYPISRRLYMYTASVPKNPNVAPFINFVLSDAGQKVAQETGFVDMNIRTLFLDPADNESQASIQKVQGYLNAVKDAQRLSLNFRFKKNETVLDNRSVHDLDRIISFLADKLDKRIILAGFADNSGDSGYNSRLAMARAQLVASELRARGIAVGDIFSCGQEMPVASNTTEQGKEKNRRVEVWLK
jgi:phosphate transport system substrate-binding protein